MEPIDILRQQFEDALLMLRNLFVDCHDNIKKGDKILSIMKKSVQEFTKVDRKITEELLFLRAANRESSAALLRLQAKLKALVIHMRHELTHEP